MSDKWRVEKYGSGYTVMKDEKRICYVYASFEDRTEEEAKALAESIVALHNEHGVAAGPAPEEQREAQLRESLKWAMGFVGIEGHVDDNGLLDGPIYQDAIKSKLWCVGCVGCADGRSDPKQFPHMNDCSFVKAKNMLRALTREPRPLSSTALSRLATDIDSDEPFAYACPANCGCIWRDNKDGTASLFGKRSQSCEICEPLPLCKMVPLYAL